MEKKLKIKTTGGAIIHGVLNKGKRKTDTLAIFVHGLTGHPNEHTFFNAAREFPKQAIDVFRFALYTDEKGGRKLSECTITIHSEDLNHVVKYFRSKYKNITVIGHSLGSPTILKSDTSKVDNIVLWDPSCFGNEKEGIVKKVTVNNKSTFVTDWGTETILNNVMIKEWEWFNAENELELVAGLGKPLKIIAAGKGILVKGSRKYLKAAQRPKDLTVISGATHCFDEEGKEEVLLSETLSWIKKYSK